MDEDVLSVLMYIKPKFIVEIKNLKMEFFRKKEVCDSLWMTSS